MGNACTKDVAATGLSLDEVPQFVRYVQVEACSGAGCIVEPACVAAERLYSMEYGYWPAIVGGVTLCCVYSALRYAVTSCMLPTQRREKTKMNEFKSLQRRHRRPVVLVATPAVDPLVRRGRS